MKLTSKLWDYALIFAAVIIITCLIKIYYFYIDMCNTFCPSVDFVELCSNLDDSSMDSIALKEFITVSALLEKDAFEYQLSTIPRLGYSAIKLQS